MTRITQQQIADRAEELRGRRVSTATVSRVLNGSNDVTPELSEIVLSAARELGRPMHKGPIVGLIIPDARNPFFTQLAFSFEQTLGAARAQASAPGHHPREDGVHVLITNSEGRPDRELELIQRFQQLEVDGLIYVASSRAPSALYSLIATSDLPIVVVDRRITAGNLDFVAIDNRRGTQRAVDYLVVHGHEHIAYLKGLRSAQNAEDRFDAFQQAMAKNSLTLRDDWIFQGDYQYESGRECAEQLIAMDPADCPTAVLAGNDLMAIGLMQRLQQQDWQLPRDLSLIGFDNVGFSKWTYPALTTIEQPIEAMVIEATRLLLRRMDDTRAGADRRQPVERTIEPVLVPRQSVSVPRAADRAKSTAPNLVQLVPPPHGSGDE